MRKVQHHERLIAKMPSQAHHLVPQVYLKRFADRRKNLLLYAHDENQPGRIRPAVPTPVKEASAHPNFYSVARADGRLDQFFEEQMSKSENLYYALYKALRSGRPLDDRQLATLGFLAATQEARNPHYFESLADTLGRLKTFVIGDKPDGDTGWTDFVAKNVNAGDIQCDPRNIALTALPDSLEMRNTMFAGMYKCIVTSKAQNFLTSDNPVVWVDPPYFPPKGLQGFGYLRLSAEITYPLTRRQCLVMSYLPLKRVAEGDEYRVRIINARTAAHSYREIYAYPCILPSDSDREAQDIFAYANINHSLLPALLDRNGGPIRLKGVADAVGADWNDVVALNQTIVEFWRSGRFLDIDLGSIVDPDGT